MESKEIIKKILPILKKEKASRAGLFGSYARNEQTKNSDVDILVEISDDITLLGLCRIKRELENVLGLDVDLVEYCVIKKQIKKQILEEEIRII